MSDSKTVRLHLDRVEEQTALFSDENETIYPFLTARLSFPLRDGMACDGTVENGVLTDVTPSTEDGGREERIRALQKKLFHSETK